MDLEVFGRTGLMKKKKKKKKKRTLEETVGNDWVATVSHAETLSKQSRDHAKSEASRHRPSELLTSDRIPQSEMRWKR